ncbi:uncharacterized protein LOC135812779 [Sycon ciliatum]|uniref:uncharacterized protein LOC135812779 n=1 Tax=Sycon ciliatum TaxID=27933 RepID=UPI0031F67026
MHLAELRRGKSDKQTLGADTSTHTGTTSFSRESNRLTKPSRDTMSSDCATEDYYNTMDSGLSLRAQASSASQYQNLGEKALEHSSTYDVCTDKGHAQDPRLPALHKQHGVELNLSTDYQNRTNLGSAARPGRCSPAKMASIHGNADIYVNDTSATDYSNSVSGESAAMLLHCSAVNPTSSIIETSTDIYGNEMSPPNSCTLLSSIEDVGLQLGSVSNSSTRLHHNKMSPASSRTHIQRQGNVGAQHSAVMIPTSNITDNSTDIYGNEMSPKSSIIMNDDTDVYGNGMSPKSSIIINADTDVYGNGMSPTNSVTRIACVGNPPSTALSDDTDVYGNSSMSPTNSCTNLSCRGSSSVQINTCTAVAPDSSSKPVTCSSIMAAAEDDNEYECGDDMLPATSTNWCPVTSSESAGISGASVLEYENNTMAAATAAAMSPSIDAKPLEEDEYGNNTKPLEEDEYGNETKPLEEDEYGNDIIPTKDSNRSILSSDAIITSGLNIGADGYPVAGCKAAGTIPEDIYECGEGAIAENVYECGDNTRVAQYHAQSTIEEDIYECGDVTGVAQFQAQATIEEDLYECGDVVANAAGNTSQYKGNQGDARQVTTSRRGQVHNSGSQLSVSKPKPQVPTLSKPQVPTSARPGLPVPVVPSSPRPGAPRR